MGQRSLRFRPNRIHQRANLGFFDSRLGQTLGNEAAIAENKPIQRFGLAGPNNAELAPR